MFDNLAGLYALLAIIPFILIYLIRPKNFERTIPSLMFLMAEKRNFQKASFLQKLLRNLMFILQLLTIILLALAVAAPSIELPRDVLVKNNIIVIDASASMQTKDGIQTRFQKALGEAQNHIGIKNSVILAENTPVLLLENARGGEAVDVIRKIKPRATTSNLGGAILLAGDLLADEKGLVTVISDFQPTEGSDVLLAKRTLTAKGNTVNFIDLSSDAKNIGIIDLQVSKTETQARIRSFIDEPVTVKAQLIQNVKTVSDINIDLGPQSSEIITFPTLQGLSKISIDVQDDLPLDNTVHISTPNREELRVLLITNEPIKNKLKAVLKALGANVEIREPPTVNAYNVDHDIVIIDRITKKLFVPTDFVDLGKYVDAGGNLIIAAQEDLSEVNTIDLLPVNVQELNEEQTTACVDVIGSIFPKDPYADDPCFTTVKKFPKAFAHNDTVTLIRSATDDSSLMTYKTKGQGQVVYFGIMDKYTSFYGDPFFPIFWNNMINWLMKTEDIRSFNYAAGKLEIVAEQEVKTPTQSITTNRILLDEAGIYEYNNKKVAVNSLSEKESNVGRETVDFKDELKLFSEEKTKTTEPFDLEIPIIILVLILIFGELIYIKLRGDL